MPNESPELRPERGENETREAYVARRKVVNKLITMWLRGRMFFQSVRRVGDRTVAVTYRRETPKIRHGQGRARRRMHIENA